MSDQQNGKDSADPVTAVNGPQVDGTDEAPAEVAAQQSASAHDAEPVDGDAYRDALLGEPQVDGSPDAVDPADPSADVPV
jgi:hypothetical protein